MTTSPRSTPSKLSRTAIALVWLLATASAIAVLLIAASAAEGGAYRVAQCNPRYDAGRADLTFDRNSDHYASASACDGGGGLSIRHEARRSHRDRWGEWGLRAPEGTHVHRIRARVSGVAAAGHTPELYAGASGGGGTFGRAIGPAHLVRWRGAGTDGFSARLRCTNATCGEGREARMVVSRVGLLLFDSLAPRVRPAGPLTDGDTRRGVQGFTPLATDAGGGVRNVYLAVNGEPIAARRLPCDIRRRIATRLAPCPLKAQPSFTLNTAAGPFRQGPNRLRVCAADLANDNDRNRDCARRRVRVDNECPVDSPAARGKLTVRMADGGRRQTVPHGEPASVVGRLADDSGRGIAHADVCVATRSDAPGSVERVVASPTTDGDGRFTAHLDPGPSREVRVAHWAGPQHVTERYLRLAVRARPTLRLRPERTLHNGERVRFAVRLHGPEQGSKRFHVKVRTRSGWYRLRTETTNADGAWRGSYRFHATTGLRTYRFRAFVPGQPGYPFTSGWSRTQEVRVQGG